MRGIAALLVLTACTSAPPAAEPLVLNPFNDPFVRATHGRPCPAPRGPAYTEAQRLQEGHYRVERGTSCWLAGQCSEPNAYRYDSRIAEAAVAALRSDTGLAAASSIWIIAERRFVHLQGCVADAAQAARAEAVVKALPDVQLVIPSLSLPGEAPRYPRRASH